MAKYYKAQICINGHVISSCSDNKSDFCPTCGSETITKCPNCKSDIRGKEYAEGVPVLGRQYELPSYCHNCGNPYPWTLSKLEAIKEMIDFDEKLSEVEKAYIKNNTESLTSDNPNTTVVATKVKYYLSKAGSVTVSALRDILVDIISESAKKIIFP